MPQRRAGRVGPPVVVGQQLYYESNHPVCLGYFVLPELGMVFSGLKLTAWCRLFLQQHPLHSLIAMPNSHEEM